MFGFLHQQKYGANKGVGETPLNGKSMPLTGKKRYIHVLKVKK
jgi:hypothetical protein